MTGFTSFIRSALFLMLAGLVFTACDSSGPDAPVSDLTGNYRVASVNAYTVVTTRADDAVVLSNAQSSTMSIGDGAMPFQYVSVGKGERVGDGYVAREDLITLYTALSPDLSDPGAFPWCTLEFTAYTVTSGTASDLPSPRVKMYCSEDVHGEQSSFEPAGDFAFTFDPAALTVDLPPTLMRQIPDTPSSLGTEVTVGGQFTGQRVPTAAGVPTRIDGMTRLVELGLQSGSIPVDAEIDLLADGTFESRYDGPVTIGGTTFSPVIERGTWASAGGKLSVTTEEINGVPVTLQPIGSLVFEYEQVGDELVLELGLDACSSGDPYTFSTCLNRYGRLLGLANPDGISALQRGATTRLRDAG
jgi:hypothetical protein